MKVIEEAEEFLKGTDILDGHTDTERAKGIVRGLLTEIERLKEREAVEPKVSSTEQRCGNCNKVIEMDGWIACPWCGKPIAWNEWWNKNGGQAVKRK